MPRSPRSAHEERRAGGWAHAPPSRAAWRRSTAGARSAAARPATGAKSRAARRRCRSRNRRAKAAARADPAGHQEEPSGRRRGRDSLGAESDPRPPPRPRPPGCEPSVMVKLTRFRSRSTRRSPTRARLSAPSPARQARRRRAAPRQARPATRTPRPLRRAPGTRTPRRPHRLPGQARAKAPVALPDRGRRRRSRSRPRPPLSARQASGTRAAPRRSVKTKTPVPGAPDDFDAIRGRFLRARGRSLQDRERRQLRRPCGGDGKHRSAPRHERRAAAAPTRNSLAARVCAVRSRGLGPPAS